MANPVDIMLLESAEQSADGSGAEVDLGTLRRAVRLRVVVASWTLGAPPPDEDPSLTLTVETRASSSAPWGEASSLAVTEVGSYDLSAGNLERYVRLSWALGTGLDAVTFGAAGQAHVIYADPRDIARYVVPERSIEDISASARADACIAATDEADSYIGGAYELPLLAWDEATRTNTARIAAAILFSQRGSDPQGPDAGVFLERDNATKWFDRLANGRLSPPGIVDSSDADGEYEGGSVVLSRPSREW